MLVFLHITHIYIYIYIVRDIIFILKEQLNFFLAIPSVIAMFSYVNEYRKMRRVCGVNDERT